MFMEPAQVTSTLESLEFLQVAIVHEVDELNKMQRNLNSVEAAKVALLCMPLRGLNKLTDTFCASRRIWHQ